MVKKEVTSNIMVENARIGFRNFTGKEQRFNPKGNRNFVVFLEEDLGKTLKRDGWNVKWLEPRNPDEDKQAYLPIAVSYNNYPPMITLISSSGKAILDEDSVNILDWADITYVDLIVRPYNWELNEKSGVKAYLKTMYATIAEDPFESKYKDAPDPEPDDDIPF